MSTTYPRRHFLKATAAAAAGGALLGGPFQGLMARAAGAAAGDTIDGYGGLVAIPDSTTGMPLLALPAGFRYWSFGWTGEKMSDNERTPGRHDGMAAFPGGTGQVVLVRNHERGYSPANVDQERLFGKPKRAYDKKAGGGCTTLVWNTNTQRLEQSYVSINGTAVNCAGGPIGNSWFTCEETTSVATDGGFEKAHGYVFEVPAGQVVSDPQPIIGMGRFRHEAVSKDAITGTYLLTEDSGSSSGLYRFTPSKPSDLHAGGKLEMLKVTGQRHADLGGGFTIGEEFDIEWVEVEPDPDPSNPSSELVFNQGWEQGAARMSRLEGIWYSTEDGQHYFTSTSGGAAGLGQVWAYDDVTGTLTLIFESGSAHQLDSPDNITVSPRGHLLLCEDGDDDQYLRGLTVRGEIFDFARNEVVLDGRHLPGKTEPGDYRDKEFAGACFSPDGQWLFVNIQTPGVTFAITGPWGELL